MQAKPIKEPIHRIDLDNELMRKYVKVFFTTGESAEGKIKKTSTYWLLIDSNSAYIYANKSLITHIIVDKAKNGKDKSEDKEAVEK